MRKFILAASLLAGWAPSAWCVPQILNYQGRLSESGAPVAGARDMTFRIFNTSSLGIPLFIETRTVSVSSGIFTVLIGDVTSGGIPLSVFDGLDKFVEVQIGATTLPRQRIASVGYSLRSQVASFADRSSTAAFAQTAGALAGFSAEVSVASVTATIINATSMTVNNISMTSANVRDSVLVEGGVKIGHSIILGAVSGTPGADNTIAFDNGPGTIISTNPGAGSLTLATVDANHIILAPGGNVGIGTATPEAKLEVAGQVKITGGGPGAGKVLTSDAAGLASWTAPSGGGGWVKVAEVVLGADGTTFPQITGLSLSADHAYKFMAIGSIVGPTAGWIQVVFNGDLVAANYQGIVSAANQNGIYVTGGENDFFDSSSEDGEFLVEGTIMRNFTGRTQMITQSSFMEPILTSGGLGDAVKTVAMTSATMWKSTSDLESLEFYGGPFAAGSRLILFKIP